MFGKAYFIDGHDEPIINYNHNPQGTELYFTTPSGQYGYKQCAWLNDFEMTCSRLIFTHCERNFYIYDQDLRKWFATANINHIEIFTEVLSNA